MKNAFTRVLYAFDKQLFFVKILKSLGYHNIFFNLNTSSYIQTWAQGQTPTQHKDVNSVLIRTRTYDKKYIRMV